MKEKINHFKDIWVLLLSVYSFLIAFGSAVPNLLLGLIGLFFVFGIASKKFSVSLEKLKWILVFSTFYFVYFISLTYSSNLDYGVKKLTLQAILVATPLIIISAKEFLSKKDIIRIVQFNILGSLLFIAISLILATKNWILSGGGFRMHLTGKNLSNVFVDIHFLELALLISFNILCLVYLKLNEKKLIFNPLNRFFFIIIFLLIGFLVLLNSRTALVATTLVLIFQIISHSIKIRNHKPAIIVVLFLSLLLMSNYVFNQGFKQKINEAFNIDVSYAESKNWGGRGMRSLIWKCSTKVLKDNLLFGVGIGDQQDELTLCYNKYRYGPLIFNEKKFNSHNIFIQSSIVAGLFGLAFYLASLLIPALISFQNKKYLYLLFLVIFVLNGTTESLLQVNFGVTFFSFFNALLFNLNFTNESITST